MITSLFYYNHYKPYILRTANLESSTVSKRKEKLCKKESLNDNFLLNKALKDDVVSYVRSVSTSVVDSKVSSKSVVQRMDKFNYNIEKRGFSKAKNSIGDSLRDFVDSYNEAEGFLAKQGHSSELKNYAVQVSQDIGYNVDRLGLLGISLSEDSQLSFDEEYFYGLKRNDIYSAIGETINIFQNICNYSDDVLKSPLIEHMKFKNLGYYYNYKLGSMETDTFKIIESGLLIDKAV